MGASRIPRGRESRPLSSLLIKPAGPDCNLACDYCFYREKSALFPPGAHRMSEQTLAMIVRQAMAQSGPSISFAWQGGEPTLMGLNFFKTAVELQRRHHRGQSVGNALQTNGMLLDAVWARFLAREGVLVGLSVDGPAHVHDRYRRTASGKGTWDKVADAARLLLDHGVAVNALAVVNDYSADFADEVYGTLKDLGLTDMQFIPCVEAGQGGGLAPFSVDPEKLGRFWRRAYDRWRADFKDGLATTTVRLFDSIFYTYVGLDPPECALHETCGEYLAVEHDGSVYPCDFFVEPELKLGQVGQDLLIDMLESPKQREFGLRKADTAAECKKCKWLAHCRGGCPKERGFGADRRVNHLCPAYRALFEHVHRDMTELSKTWKKTRPRAVAPESSGAKQELIGRNQPCPCGSGKKYKKCCGA